MEDNLALQPGELCNWCKKELAQPQYKFYPAHYFCSMKCKVEWYKSSDDEPMLDKEKVKTHG